MRRMTGRVVAFCMLAILCGPVLAQDQIVIPDEDTRFIQEAPTGGGTGLTMRAVTVKDQNQLRGAFGDKWQPDEVRARAAQVCAEAGMRLVYFQPGNRDSKGRTQFAAVCQ
ncbi:MULTISPECIES: hypothetical protein [Mameliella]|uniref:Integration host factor subunit beta n=1 Tax=Mameliella alba TaxID=561184 RepID=A0A0B3SRC1_9RHOB|nr:MULTISPECIES: hypothetical protein [Mameliella]MBV6638497.1 hypothetical protein [Mameliella sp.]KHQ52984.1 Integration host factor subunit beta [Mameliella alba]MBY6120875.1 hypothetical protein [Mameliella alba]PTR37606.1 hypothetical protein LX94_03425 [Mameliella alba]SDD66768.1 hypothetical protein SAMN05216376_110148 [Mameliella alba]